MTSPHRQFEIPALDGFALGARHFTPADPTSDVIIINAAMAVPQHFYRHYARHLASQGHHTLTYDYRGIGLSRPHSLRGFKARMRDWAELDMAAVIAWAVENLQARRLILIGHSIGGQAAGLLPDLSRISAMVTVSAQNGYWGLQPGQARYRAWVFVHIILPLLSRLIGYLPWSRFAPGEDMPKGVALEWARWARHPDYILGDLSLASRLNYEGFTAPILAYSFEDDPWGSHRSVLDMMSRYCAAPRDHRHRGPEDVGGEAIGHIGFFKPSSLPLWNEVDEWLRSIP